MIIILKNDGRLIEKAATKFFEPEQLRVFRGKLPDDQKNTKIHETFVAQAPSPALPENKEQWEKMRDGWMKGLREKVFRGWPEKDCPLGVKEVFAEVDEKSAMKVYEFTSQHRG